MSAKQQSIDRKSSGCLITVIEESFVSMAGNKFSWQILCHDFSSSFLFSGGKQESIL